MAQPDALLAALDRVADPLTGRGLAEGGRARSPKLVDGTASVVVDVTGLSADVRTRLEQEVQAALGQLAGVEQVRVALTSERRGRRIVAIGSGKGGVGKSTLSANLAVALARMGEPVGLVDADIYGPSQPRLLAAEGIRPTAVDQRMEPVQTPYGVPLLSMGMLIDPGRAVAWRGPMAGNALGQLLDADWGAVRTLLVDLPPGTGDIQLSMLAKHKPAGAIIVSTPQDLALMDATRAIDLFAQTDVPVIGLVENMAGYQCPHCGELSDPFGQGGCEAAARTMGLPFLGRVPLDIAVRTASDNGEPPAWADEEAGAPFHALARGLLAWLNPAATPTF